MIRKSFAIILTSLCLLSSPSMAKETKTGTISLTVSGLRNAKGHLLVDLFSSAAGFPEEPKKALRNLVAKIRNGKASVLFTGVRYGRYALSIMHDEDDNKDLATNWYGKPLEGVSTSNSDGKPSTGTPSFDDAVFKFAKPTLTLTIPMTYYD